MPFQPLEFTREETSSAYANLLRDLDGRRMQAYVNLLVAEAAQGRRAAQGREERARAQKEGEELRGLRAALRDLTLAVEVVRADFDAWLLANPPPAEEPE